MLPTTITPTPGVRKDLPRRGPVSASPSCAQDAYQRLPRARRHTVRTLRSLRRATSAPDRRGGHDAPAVPHDVVVAVPRWSSRHHLLTVIRVLGRQPYVNELCRREGIAVETWQAIVSNDALDADSDGRNMRTTKTVAAARVGRGEEQVKRARRIAVRLGIMVEVFRGRELTKVERVTLTARSPGHRQRGLASNYSMTICGPRQRARIATPRPGEFAQVYPPGQANVPLPPEGGLNLPSHLLQLLPLTAADASEEAEPPSAARHRRKRRRGMTLAFEVLTHPGLALLLASVRPGTIAAQLAPHHAGGWHGHGLAAAILVEADRLGISTRESAHSPWALIKVLLSQIDPVADVHLGIRPRLDCFSTPLPTQLKPCGGPECDGFGWINGVDQLGYAYARPCPDCPPGVRANRASELAPTARLDGDDEPPF